MTNREYIKTQIDVLPDGAIEKLIEFIAFQKFSLGIDNDTDYLQSIPGMTDKLKAGMNTPLADCVPLSEVWADV